MLKGSDPFKVMRGLDGLARLALTAVPKYNTIGKVASGLVGAGLGYGLSQEIKDFMAENAPKMHRLLEEKRVKEQARVNRRARGRKILYHYSSRPAVLAIGMFGVGLSSPGFGAGRPAGFYASDIPPWSIQYTQEDLSALFYGGNRFRDVSWFAAIDGTSFMPYSGNGHEHFSPSNTGEINLDVITIGPNLMLPK